MIDIIYENMNIIIIVCIILFIRIVFLKAVKRNQLAVIYKRDKYIKTRTFGYVFRFSYRDNQLYRTRDIDNTRKEYVILIDKNKVNWIYLGMLLDISDMNKIDHPEFLKISKNKSRYADALFRLYIKITDNCAFDKSFGKVFDDFIKTVKKYFIQYKLELFSDNCTGIDIESKINMDFMSRGIEFVEFGIVLASITSDEKDIKMYKNYIKQEERTKAKEKFMKKYKRNKKII